MKSPNHPDHRESLSALFDGELHGDAARFAHKRLAQDVQWRQACGNWQLVGDVLRGQATAAAPDGFADRVQLALAHEAAVAADMPGQDSKPSRRGWIGGAALAASVAVAAWFVASPLDEAAPAVMTPASSIAAATQPAAAPVPLSQDMRTTKQPDQPADGARPARAPVQRNASRSARGDQAASAGAVPASSMAATASPTSQRMPSAIDATALPDPFGLPTRPVAKTWPRAVLPGYPSAATLTAGYSGPARNGDALADESPTFYPFEPRLPPATDAIDAPPAARWP